MAMAVCPGWTVHKMASRIRLSVLGLLTFFSAVAYAQDTASLTGTVRDKSGAAIPGVDLVLRNVATGTDRQLTTNTDGEYLAAALQPGQYNITATAPGFRRYQAQGVIFGVAQNARIN